LSRRIAAACSGSFQLINAFLPHHIALRFRALQKMSANPWHPGHQRDKMTALTPTYPPLSNILLPVNDQEDAEFTSIPMRPSHALDLRRVLAQRSCDDLAYGILKEKLGEVEWIEVPSTRRPRALPPVQSGDIASIPPADGTCYFDRLPNELLKAIFSASLPPREDIIEPRCGDALPQRAPRANRVADLLVLSKNLCGHVAETVYEERIFDIHVHQGQRNAGIEFLHVGRQPLQYQADVKDGRFSKFRPNDIFGFSRLKKLNIRIYPTEGKSRHTAVNTYYMLHALVNLLGDRVDKSENRITSLDINFVPNCHKSTTLQGRNKIRAAETPWWDTENNKPREKSFHGISDIQLMLQPFARLYGVHNVDILAPEIFSHHQPTVDFVIALKRCMKGESQSADFNNSSLNAQLDGMRVVHEDYMMKVMHGRAGAMVETDKLDDVREDDGGAEDFGNDDDDGDGAPHGPRDDPDVNDGGDDNDSEGSDSDGDNGPDSGMLKREDGGYTKRELSVSPSGQEDAKGGRKRVRFSDNISTNDNHAVGESSRMDLDDSPSSRNGVFGSRFLATESEIDLIERFAGIYDTTEEDARYWLSRSSWDIGVAASEFLDALQEHEAETLENGSDDDAMRLGIAMSISDLEARMRGEDSRARVTGRDMRAGRELDNGASPTRFGRDDGPSAHTRAQRRHLLESHPTQDEEAEDAKANGKGKGKAKKTDNDDNDADDEEDGSRRNNLSNHDELIAKRNNPSNFGHQEANVERYNPHDTEMTDDVYGPPQTAQPAAWNTDGAVGNPQSNSATERIARIARELDGFFTAQGLKRTSQVSSDSESDVFTFRPQAPNFTPALPRVDDRPLAYGPVYSTAPASFVVHPPRIQPFRRPLFPSPHVRPWTEQDSTSAIQRRISKEADFLRGEAQRNASDPARAALTDLALQRLQRRSALLPQPSVPTNTAADYPQWAGASYWSAPVETAPAPGPGVSIVPEVPTSSSSVSAADTLAPYFTRPVTTGSNGTIHIDITTREGLRSLYATQRAISTGDLDAAAAGSTDAPTATSSAPATTTHDPVATSAAATTEFGDEVVYIPSDSDGEL
jgi:hypothetical protein